MPFMIGGTPDRFALLGHVAARRARCRSRSGWPTQAEREIRLSRLQHFGEWPFQEAFASEPIMPVTKAFDAGSLGEFRLCKPCFRYPQVVESQGLPEAAAGQARKKRLCFGHVGSLRKTLSPPFVVLWNRMILGKVVGD